jgi:hypothetical protein
LDTWGIFVWKREELLALKLLQLLGDINKDLEECLSESRIVNPPKIFPVNSGGSIEEWKKEFNDKIMELAKL